jgi:hypothetical protein
MTYCTLESGVMSSRLFLAAVSVYDSNYLSVPKNRLVTVPSHGIHRTKSGSGSAQTVDMSAMLSNIHLFSALSVYGYVGKTCRGYATTYLKVLRHHLFSHADTSASSLPLIVHEIVSSNTSPSHIVIRHSGATLPPIHGLRPLTPSSERGHQKRKSLWS